MEEKTIIQKIPLEKIRPNKLNNYDVTDEGNTLKTSIAAFGLQSALAVIGPYDDGTYRLIAGERRYHVVSELNKESNGKRFNEVPVIIIGDQNMSEDRQIAEIEISNLVVRYIPPEETISHKITLFRTLTNMEKEGEIDSAVKEFSKILHSSVRSAQMYQSITKTDEEYEGFADAIQAVRIPLGKVTKIAKDLDNLPQEEKEAIKADAPNMKDLLANAESEEERTKILAESLLGTQINNFKTLEEASAATKEEMKDFNPVADSFQSTVSNKMFDESDDYEDYSDDSEEEKYSKSTTAENILFDERGIRSNVPNRSQDDFSKSSMKSSMGTDNNASDFRSIEEQNFRNKIIQWCKQLLEKAALNKEEEEVVEVFRRVTDKF